MAPAGSSPDRPDDGPADALTARPGEWSRRVQLRDGTGVLLRQIRPADRERLEEGLRQLSPASRYLRFHAAVDELSEEHLRYLTEVDHVDHEAIVALDLDHPDRPGVGVARYIREPYDEQVAEAAITVADAYQGRGAGTLLLGALAARARDNGVTVFRNYVLEGNHAMLEVFDHLGAHRELETEGLWRVDLSVPGSDDDLPESGAGRAFLAVARGERRLASLIPPIWSRVRRHARTAGRTLIGRADAGASGSAEDDAELTELRQELDAWLQDPRHR